MVPLRMLSLLENFDYFNNYINVVPYAQLLSTISHLISQQLIGCVLFLFCKCESWDLERVMHMCDTIKTPGY